MIFSTLAAALLAASGSPAAAADAKILTLDDAYAAALVRSETIAEKGETYAQVLAQIDEIWAAVQPRLNLNANHVWQDTPGQGVNFPLPANQDTVAINGHQPIFAGLRDFLAVRATKVESESAELALTRAKQLLYQDVAGAYLNELQNRRQISTLEAQVKLTDDRIKELKNFVDIGRSRKSEILAAQSQLAQDQADLAAARGGERLSQETLQFLTGLSGELAPQEVETPAAADDIQSFLDRAQTRPDVEAARKDFEYADIYVTMQGRQHLPTVFLDGNYYLRRPNNFSKNVHWDATLTGQLPIYYGGQIAAQVREAKAARGIKEAALSLASRQAALEVRSAHSDLESDLSVVKALQNAMNLAEANAKAQAEDYRHGMVTNIDVLTSLTVVQNTRLRLDQAEIQAYDARVRLEVAAGGPRSVK
ncbi:MAG: TolC family protein [Elusimicrobia bacterium]|nr:TolC family protein [Elusimicrobiota bacterium]MDE2510868.1 TolC family protein [Elusimicrobiota bacterium]